MNSTRQVWRRESRELRRWRSVFFYLGFVGVLGLACASIAGLVTLVNQPFTHPRVQFLFLTGADLSGNLDGYFDQSGIAFPSEELAGLNRVRQIVFGSTSQPVATLERWRSPNDMRSLGIKLIEQNLSAGDVAVIEVLASGISLESDPQLCWNFGRTVESTGRVRVAEMMQQITSSTKACKLLILDAGNVESLPQEGMCVNDFSRQLEKLVHSTNDESLWVLCSHGPLESSHVLEFMQRSVFGYYLEKGLTGAADLNRDREIDIGELHTWVAHAVAEYVDRRSGGTESQTPQLYWGGARRFPDGNLPIVVPVRRSNPASPTATTKPTDTKNADGSKPVSGSASEKSAGPATGVIVPEGTPPPQDLISEAWHLVEAIQSRKTDAATAADLAPRMIGNLTDRLRSYEILSGGTFNVAPLEVSNRLLPIIAPLRGITSNPPVPPSSTGMGLGTRLAKTLVPLPLPALPIRSLALAELLATRNIQKLPDGYAELSQALDKFLKQDERTGFDDWLAKREPAELALVELHGIGLLAGVPDVDWPLLRKALTARRIGEQAAVQSLGSLGIVVADIERGDRDRLAGEKLLLDGVQPDRYSRAVIAMDSACATYQLAEIHSAKYLRSVQLKNDLLLRARVYVRWRRIAARRSDKVTPEFEQVADFLVDLNRYCQLIEHQVSSDEMEIKDLTVRLLERQRQIEATASDDFVQTLASSASSPTDMAQIEALLETSLISGELRPQLRAAGIAAASAISLEATFPDLRRKVTAPRIVLQRQRDCLSQQLHLEWLVAQISEIPDEGSSQTKSPLAQLQRTAEAVQKCQQECTERPGSLERLNAWWDACEEFDTDLKTWNQELPERLHTTVTRLSDGQVDPTIAARAWRGVSRTLALLAAQGYRSENADDFLSQSQLAEWRELMVFLGRRARAALPDASPRQIEYLVTSAESFRQAALAIGTVPPISPLTAPLLRLSGKAELSLSQETEGELLITIQNRSSDSQNAWIGVDYDRNLLDVKLPADYSVFRQQASSSPGDLRKLNESLSGPSLRALPPSLSLDPGSQRVLKFVVRRLGSRAWPANLIVKATSDDCEVRHECAVHAPAPEIIELLVGGPGGSWTATPTGFQLHPFPNQRTVYRLFIQNRGVPRAVNLELLPLERRLTVPIPGGTLPKDQAEALLRGIAIGPKLAAVSDFKLEPDGKPHPVPFTGPPPPDLDKPKKPDAGTTEILPGVEELPYGALFTITERTSGSKIIKYLEFMPQRPRRYVTARVEHHPDLQLFDVVVRRKDNAVTPEKIKVRCELGAFPRTDSSPRTVAGEIAEGQKEIRFTLPVPTGSEGLLLAIAVDDYPRAFRYQISSLLPGGEVSEDTGSMAVRATVPDHDGIFACPRKSVDAVVEVDAPPGNFPDSQGFWEIGIDKGLDRELVGDNVVRFVTDRQARPKLNGYLPDGGLAIDTPVSDFRVQLPADGVCNQRALVVAHASFSGRDVWSVPVNLILDGTGPRVTNVAVGPERLLISGEAVEVSAIVQDGELSGVSKVEVSFDLAGTGRFAKEPPPELAVLSGNGNWIAKLSTEKMIPGSYLILLRATDKVGNEGEYSRFVATLISKEERARQRAAVRVAVRGIVEFKTQPVPDIKVSLVAAETDPKGSTADKSAGNNAQSGSPSVALIAPTQTDKGGQFVFSSVPPGKFKLRAEGIVRNKIRKVEVDITVDEQTPFKPSLQLKLP